jgi:CRP-like cAMP-binding protein
VLREDDGQTQHLADLESGDYFGEMAVLGNVSRSATVTANSPTDVLLIPRDDFHLLQTSVPAFGDVFERLAQARAAANRERGEQ